MADKKLQQLNNTRTSVVSGDQFAIGGTDGFTYRAELTVLQSFLLENSLTISTIKAPQSAVVKAAIDSINTILTTDNASLDDFQKITDAIEAIQATLSVNDANYNTLQKIVDKLKIAETKLATIATDADVNVQADWDETDNTNDAFIKNKPALGTASLKNVGTAVGNLQENGAILGNSQTVETDSAGKFITVAKNTAYNANFGTGNTDAARGDASYPKTDTYTKTEADALLATKEATANKGVAGGYASLDGNAQVPLSQIPANAKSSKVVADIATRDVIASADRFEGLRVHVLNATADTTVTSGSAGYILKSGLTNSDWAKIYESESLDIDLSDYFKKTTDTTDNITVGTAKFTTQADIDKLAGIEANATADQSDLEIKTAYENNVNTNAFTDAEQTKLAGVATGATANSTDATLLNRANHTGTQTLSTISDAGLLAGKDTVTTSDVDNNAITTAKIEQVASKIVLGRTTAGTGDVEEIAIATTLKTDLSLTSTDVGLGNVDNTSDAAKPISTAQQTALDAKLAKASNLSDVTNRQTAVDNLTDVANANNEYVLTKDTTTGNAVFKPALGGGLNTALPPGAIIPWLGALSSIPSGFLYCDNSSYNTTTYANLFAVIGTYYGSDSSSTFKVPELRGEVLRGTDNGSGNDPDADSRTTLAGATDTDTSKAGTYQADEVNSHDHHLFFEGSADNNSPALTSSNYALDTSSVTWSTDYRYEILATSSVANNGKTSAIGGNETRMRNMSVHWLIKY